MQACCSGSAAFCPHLLHAVTFGNKQNHASMLQRYSAWWCLCSIFHSSPSTIFPIKPGNMSGANNVTRSLCRLTHRLKAAYSHPSRQVEELSLCGSHQSCCTDFKIRAITERTVFVTFWIRASAQNHRTWHTDPRASEFYKLFFTRGRSSGGHRPINVQEHRTTNRWCAGVCAFHTIRAKINSNDFVGF